ncbi:amidase [Marivirga lumbricoides]|uniref:Amidase n=1 Tax=Marivirga lumbricoides TaxID=1046115 RepID=A0ABQ1LBB2_9BACT|nr:amidase [Marivirga lumbricoides]
MKKSHLITLISAIAIFIAGFAINDVNEITKEDILSTLKLLGLNYSEAEVDSLHTEIVDLKASYQKIRSSSPSNEVIPANIFSPSTMYPPANNRADDVYIRQGKVEMPKNKEDLAFYSIKELAWLIENQKITPLELTHIYLNRIKKYDDTLKSVVNITEELALQQAKKATEEIKKGVYKGLLHGIPYGVKDLLAVEGYKTTWGAMPYKDQVINETATVVKKLEERGAVLIAKLTLGALAYGDIWYGGVTKNPWNLNQGSSGSSAGPASATVAGLVAFSIGSETLGSIVSPSTRCGASGLRPTFGGVSRNGAMALSWSMDKLGPICRSAEDAAIVFAAIHGKDEKDPYSLDYNFSYHPEKAKLKVVYAKDLFSNSWNARNDSMMLATFRKNGIKIEAVDWFKTDLPVGDLSIILTAEAAAAFDELIISGAAGKMVWQDKNAWPNLFRAARTIPAVEYINANRLRTQLISQYQQWIKQYDAVIVPSFGGNQLLVTNLTGHPSVVLPNGFNPNESPTSFTITGNYYAEGKLLELAGKFQALTDYHNRRPPYFNK